MSLETIRKALEVLLTPATPVRGWIVEEGTDSTGNDAYWVWAVVPDELLSDMKAARASGPVRKQVRLAVRDAVERIAGSAAHPWVYVRFVTQSEA
jgi:hypothetical protein